MVSERKIWRMHKEVSCGREEVRVRRPLGAGLYTRPLSYGLVTPREVAMFLGVTTQTVWNMVARGALRRTRRGSRVYFVLSAVRAQQRLLEERRGQHAESHEAGH